MFVETLKQTLISLMAYTRNHAGNASHLEWNGHNCLPMRKCVHMLLKRCVESNLCAPKRRTAEVRKACIRISLGSFKESNYKS